MSTSQVAFYTNRVGKFGKMRRDGRTNRQTKPGSDKTNAHLWHIDSSTPTHKLITVLLRCTVTTIIVYVCSTVNPELRMYVHCKYSFGWYYYFDSKSKTLVKSKRVRTTTGCTVLWSRPAFPGNFMRLTKSYMLVRQLFWLPWWCPCITFAFASSVPACLE